MAQRKIMTNKKIGITSNVIVDRIGMDGYALIKKAGFDTIDFNMQRGFFSVKKNGFLCDMVNSIIRHKKEIELCGLTISQTHAPYYTLEKYMQCDAELECYFDAVEQALWATILLECKRFVIHPLHTYDWMKTSEFELTHKLIKRISNIAKNKGIYICMENLPYDFCGNYIKHSFFLEMLKEYNVKGCFDTGHSKMCDKNVLEHLKYLRDKIYVVHIHDNDGIKDLHSRIRPNSLEWQNIFSEIEINKNIISYSLETSGIYKICKVDDIYNELVMDYESVCSYIDKNNIEGD